MALSHLRRKATAAALVTATAALVLPTLTAAPASATERAATSLAIRAVHAAVRCCTWARSVTRVALRCRATGRCGC